MTCQFRSLPMRWASSHSIASHSPTGTGQPWKVRTSACIISNGGDPSMYLLMLSDGASLIRESLTLFLSFMLSPVGLQVHRKPASPQTWIQASPPVAMRAASLRKCAAPTQIRRVTSLPKMTMIMARNASICCLGTAAVPNLAWACRF